MKESNTEILWENERAKDFFTFSKGRKACKIQRNPEFIAVFVEVNKTENFLVKLKNICQIDSLAITALLT